MIIEGTVIEITPEWLLVEYSQDDQLQRKYVPRALVDNVHTKGPVSFDEYLLQMGIEYSNVDLVAALGDQLPPISVRELQNALRQAGVWTRADYQAQSGIRKVSHLLQQLRGYDASLILNAANREIASDDTTEV